MATKGNPRDFLILTNNPLVVSCMEGKGLWTIEYHEGLSYREVLVLVRDKVYAGHTLYTHPLAGSVKPNVRCKNDPVSPRVVQLVYENPMNSAGNCLSA